MASSGLVDRGLVDVDGTVTGAGISVKERVESTTDHLAAAPWRDVVDVDALHLQLRSLADAIRRSGLVPVPNPIGLD